MNMEKQKFIHADLSDGNVMVTPSGPYAGDMALVDFDSFIHPAHPHLDSTCKGTDGYSAPEIFNSKSNLVNVGSDRLALAILVQEFLIMGDPTISSDEALEWRYEQSEILSLKGEAYSIFTQKYPRLAQLVVQALQAKDPNTRPAPDLWRPMLKELAKTGAIAPRGKKLTSVALNAYPNAKPELIINFADTQKSLDLNMTPYGVRATLERNVDGSIDAVVHTGADIRASSPSNRTWVVYDGGDRIALSPDLILYDTQKKMNVRISGTEN